FRAEKKNVKLRIIFPDVWEQTYKNLYAQKCVDKFEKFLFRKLYRVLRYENGLVYGIDAANIGNEKKNWNMFATETSKNNLAQSVALLAKNSYKYYNETMLTEKDLARFRCGTQLFDADWLESSSNRCRTLVSFYYNFGKLYNHAKLKEMDDSITVDDVIEKTRGYFDGGISIITQGSNFTADLKSIWLENFKHFD
ncbi:MAG: hypothetical protein MJ158_03270, partial [Alphaproteobacteria bacterium]|nr:hypothetical protein [Alphaproteobacteria bacterium]